MLSIHSTPAPGTSCSGHLSYQAAVLSCTLIIFHSLEFDMYMSRKPKRKEVNGYDRRMNLLIQTCSIVTFDMSGCEGSKIYPSIYSSLMLFRMVPHVCFDTIFNCFLHHIFSFLEYNWKTNNLFLHTITFLSTKDSTIMKVRGCGEE